MTYDSDIAGQAQAYADTLLANNAGLVHSSNASRNNPSQGENLAWSSAELTLPSLGWASKAWYDEVTDIPYDFNNPGW